MPHFLSAATKKEKIILFAIIAFIVLIPSGSFLLSQRFHAKEEVKKLPDTPVTTKKKTVSNEVPKLSPADLLKQAGGASDSADESPPSLESEKSTVYFGPTMSFKLNIQGRPTGKQASKVFLGVALGQPIASSSATQPQYLLSFMIEVPDTGTYTGLSMAGLEQGKTYTAYLKGTSQIATAAAFFVKPTPTDLGTLNLLTGDANEDNTINTEDYNIVKSALNQTPASPNWNPNLDFNLDNIINIRDLAIVSSNLNRTGASGIWYSKPSTATSSGNLATDPTQSSTGGLIAPIPSPTSGGYWQWMPAIP